MDTYVHPRIWGYDRQDFIESKEVLMNRSRTLATGGRDSIMAEMLESYQEAEQKVARDIGAPGA
jgi:hypothetical protein